MTDSKLFTFLQTLEKQEWKALKKYLLGSVGDSSEIFTLFDRIYAYRNKLNHKHLDLIYQLSQFYPQLERKAVLNIISRLTKEVENYFIITELKTDQRALDLLKLKAFNKRALYKYADKTGEKMRDSLNDPNHLDIWNQWYLLAANHDLYFSYNPVKHTSDGPMILREAITSLTNFSDTHFQYLNMESRNREIHYAEGWEDEIIQTNINLKADITPLSLCLNKLKLFYVEPTDATYQELYDILLNKEYKIDERVGMAIVHRLSKYQLLQLKSGNEGMAHQIAELLYESIKKGYLLLNGLIMPSNYLTCIIALANTHQWEKAKEILIKGENIISPDIRKKVLAIAKMNILLVQDNTEELIQLYNKIDFEILKYKAYAGPLVLRAHYQELKDDTTFIEYQIRNFQEYWKRHKSDIATKHYEGKSNFITALKMLVRAKTKTEIQQFMDQSDNVYYRFWIKQQLKNLS